MLCDCQRREGSTTHCEVIQLQIAMNAIPLIIAICLLNRRLCYRAWAQLVPFLIVQNIMLIASSFIVPKSCKNVTDALDT